MFQNRHFVFISIFILAGITSCSLDRRISKKLAREFNRSKIIDTYQTGFALAVQGKEKIIYAKNADKYFTPASNAKLFTFYAGLKIIADSVPSLRYIEKGDSLIFWGTGDPSFLQSRLKGTRAYDFLQNSHKQLFFSPGRYTGNFYGQGWSWDDYNDDYQAEINELPLMDNLVTFKTVKGRPVITPRLFEPCFRPDSQAIAEPFKITRNFNHNEFRYPDTVIPPAYSQSIPYKTSIATTIRLLADTLHRPVQLISMKMDAAAKTIFNKKREDVLKEMMQPSDNFIAEQLLLVYANQFQEVLSSADALNYIQQEYLAELPDPPHLVDGSGLSRMNLVTPRSVIKLLDMIYKEVNDRELLFSMLPAGGKTGTLKEAYPKTDTPFVFGKTGSMSNNYNQSGYIVTKKGRVMLFSFMNNHFLQPTAAVRNEIARIVTYIHETF